MKHGCRATLSALLLATACSGAQSSDGTHAEAGVHADAAADSSAPLSCMQADDLVGERLLTDSVLVAYGECTTSADCSSWTPKLTCTDQGAELWDCPAPVHRDHVHDAEQRWTVVQTELCPRIPPGCHAGPSCPARAPRCTDSRCELVIAAGLLVDAGLFVDAGLDAASAQR